MIKSIFNFSLGLLAGIYIDQEYKIPPVKKEINHYVYQIKKEINQYIPEKK